jgi:hypothetical protein
MFSRRRFPGATTKATSGILLNEFVGRTLLLFSFAHANRSPSLFTVVR